MESIPLYIWVEPHFALTPWYSDLFSGLKAALNTKHIKANIDILDHATDDRLPYNSIVILAGETNEWYSRMIAYANERQSHACVVACDPSSDFDVSYVSTDYKADMRNMVQYLLLANRRRIALFGINPSSPHDQMRVDGYLQTIQICDLPLNKQDIFYMSGDVSDCADALLTKIDQYDAVIAGNDLYAIYLLSRLKSTDISVPQDIYLAAFGNTLLSGISRPSITTVTINMADVGKEAIYHSLHMLKNPPVTRFSVLLEGKICPRQSTENTVFSKLTIGNLLAKRQSVNKCVNISSYTDPNLLSIVKFEILLIENNKIDLSIIKNLASNQPFSQMMESLFISESTLDYHLGKLYKHFGISSRQALVLLLNSFSKYIDFSSIKV